MTKEDRNRLRELASKATPGPWAILDHGERYYTRAAVNPWYLVHVIKPMSGEPKYPQQACDRFVARLEAERDATIADAEFIAASRAAIPALLDELDAKDERIAKLESALRNLHHVGHVAYFKVDDFIAEELNRCLVDAEKALEP